MDNTTATQFAVVTGASSGIGFELAKQFAQHGFDLLIVAEDSGVHIAADKLKANGARVEALQVDLATYHGVEELCARIMNMDHPLDALAINAGVGVGGPFLKTDLKEELNLINLNITSVVHLTKRILPDMVSRNAGRILITASVASEMPAPFEAVYGASKAFDLSFAEAIRNELKDTNITITALQPGTTNTNFFHRAHMEDTKVGAGEKDDPADVARDGFEALMAGKDHVVAGSLKNKFQTTMAQILPNSVVAEQHRKVAEPGSAKA
jgi:uncharacterized protein